jgi:putative MATE family efflux protein
MSNQRTGTRDLDRLAVPAIISGIAEPVISLVDTAFVGRLGTADLAAVGIASSFFLLVVWVLAQTRSAVLAVVARYFGAGRLEEVEGLVPIAIWMNFVLGFGFFALTNAFAEPIFRMYNAEGAILEKAVAYYHIRSFGHPIVLATFAITGAFRGIQNLRWSMWISIAGAVVNGLLNPLLIFGVGPVEGMGIEGSAWASLIAQVIMFGMAVHILRARTSFRLVPTSWAHPELKGLWLLSSNLFARTIALNLCYYLGNRYATGYGEAYIAAHSIAMQVWLFSAFFIDGYAAAGSVLIGRLHGEENWKDLYRMGWQVVRKSVWIGAVLSVIYAAGYSRIGSLFTQDASVMGLLSGVFWLVVITQPINAVAFAFDGVYKGLGNGRLLRDVLLTSTFLAFIPAIVVMDRSGFLLHAIWWSFLVWMLVRGVMLALHFRNHYLPLARAARSAPR